MKRSAVLGVALFMVFALAGVCLAADSVDFMAKADASNKPGVVMGSVSNIKATVEAINAETREVTLKDDAGKTTVVNCGPEVRNFAQIKVGDVVNATYGESAAIYVDEKGGPLANTQEGTMERAPLGAKPGAKEMNVITMKGVVEDINYETRHVTIQGAEGRTLSFTAGDEVKRLNDIKKGDQIVLRLTEAAAISVTAPEAAK